MRLLELGREYKFASMQLKRCCIEANLYLTHFALAYTYCEIASFYINDREKKSKKDLIIN